ncbi:MAG TPA: NTP transferase domain-containing protein [Terriglobales bacterium]|nr:NTP transferase domain-containing protein [Terriglobales bacterium]
MPRTLRFCGVILAAGASARMGADKALLPWPPGEGNPTLLAAACLALAPHTDAVIVVAGRNAGRLAPLVAAHGAHLVVNPAPERGQFSSLQVGLRALLARSGEAAMITPVDSPPPRPATLARLRDALSPAIARGVWALAPAHDGRHGHPLLAAPALIAAFLEAPSDRNASALLRAHPQRLEYLCVADPLVGAELNTPEQYAALARAVRH